jgi:hypothetical protein
MKIRILGIVFVIVNLALSAPALAGFIDGNCAICFSDDPNLTKHAYNINYIHDDANDIDAVVDMHEGPVYVTGPDPALTCFGDMNSDPTLMIDEDALNSSGVAWTAWLLELDPNGSATFLVNATHIPSSDYFNSYSLIDSKTLKFLAPNSVPNGDTVNLGFFIKVPYTGPGIEPFSFTLTQTPIPEPATMSLLGLGALALIRRNRKS